MATPSIEPLVADLDRALRRVAIAEDAAPMARYMKDQFPFLGVKARARRDAAKPVVSQLRGADVETLLAFADECWRHEREFQYVACDVLVANQRSFDATAVPALATLVTTRSWWDTVDLLAPKVIGAIALRDRDVWPTIDAWIDGDDLWLARSAILQQLTYKERTDERVLFDRCLRRAHDTEFFIRKAIGWALRQYAYVAPEAVRSFVDAHRDELSGLSVREATKHL